VRLANAPRGALFRARRAARAVGREVSTEVDRARYRRRGGADVAVFHEFAPSPAGGGHQFLRALVFEFERRGLEIELNRISRDTPACLFNSFNFDTRRLRRFARAACRMVHRVDGPIGVYRGFDDGTDRRIQRINEDLADATVLQSQFSLGAHAELGIDLRSPVVVRNAVDPSLFHPPTALEPVAGRRLRLIGVSWSLNLNKGAEVFAWLDEHLDRTRYELTFVGQSPTRFRNIRMLDPRPSVELAGELRRHDVYVAASRNDPCSNALLEALACGLPAVYLASGGHAELVGEGGLPFSSEDDLADVLDHLAGQLEERRAAIRIPSISDVADRYLEVLSG
jgi:glycosyltransferase involved in cell wall biosynthesis